MGELGNAVLGGAGRVRFYVELDQRQQDRHCPEQRGVQGLHGDDLDRYKKAQRDDEKVCRTAGDLLETLGVDVGKCGCHLLGPP